MPHSRIAFYSCWCFKCLKSWLTKTDELPTMCPHCKSVKWDKDQDGNAGEMPDEPLQVPATKKDKRKAKRVELEGQSTTTEPAAIAPRPSNRVPGHKIWSDPVGKGNNCPRCDVGGGEEHRAFCSL